MDYELAVQKLAAFLSGPHNCEDKENPKWNAFDASIFVSVIFDKKVEQVVMDLVECTLRKRLLQC